MKHASAATLSVLTTLLKDLRKRDCLFERTPGSFYIKSKAFLHFHEDPSGIYADIKLDLLSFTRLRVTSSVEQKSFLSKVNKALAHLSKK